jgi:CRISPR-associated Csx2 family protein
MRKIITFLGRRPLPTQYAFKGQRYTGRVFAEALRQFEDFDQMLVCLTDEARQDSWPVLRDLQDARIQAVSIPRGETAEEMWQMFDAILTHVAEGDEVVFDITHGLRSLPFLIFLFAAYLKTTRAVTIRAIYYGAFELGDKEQNIPAPVIDLSGFVAMLDWITAADRFARFGDSQDLARLARATGVYKPGHPLQEATDTLEALSQALRLIRPADAMRISAQLPAVLEAALPEAQANPAARPYAFLAGDLQRAYQAFALFEPLDEQHLAQFLVKLRDLATWYVEHQQWVQAVSLAREWLITWVMWHLGETDFMNQALRESVAETMSKEAQRRKDAKDQKRPFQPLFLRPVPQIDGVLGDWLSLAGVRNDIDHAGMRRSARPADELIKSIQSLCKKLQKLPLERQSNGA